MEILASGLIGFGVALGAYSAGLIVCAAVSYMRRGDQDQADPFHR